MLRKGCQEDCCFPEAQKVLNYFSSLEPRSLSTLYLLHPLSPGQLCPPAWRPQGTLGSWLTSEVASCWFSSRLDTGLCWVCWQACFHFSGLLAGKQLQFFYCKGKLKEQTRRLRLCCGTQSSSNSCFSPLQFPRRPSSALLSRRDCASSARGWAPAGVP